MKKFLLHTLLLPVYVIWVLGTLPVVLVLSVAWMWDEARRSDA